VAIASWAVQSWLIAHHRRSRVWSSASILSHISGTFSESSLRLLEWNTGRLAGWGPPVEPGELFQPDDLEPGGEPADGVDVTLDSSDGIRFVRVADPNGMVSIAFRIGEGL